VWGCGEKKQASGRQNACKLLCWIYNPFFAPAARDLTQDGLMRYNFDARRAFFLRTTGSYIPTFD